MKVISLLVFLVIAASVSAQQNRTIILINGNAYYGSIPAIGVARVTIQSNVYDEFELFGSGCQIVKVGDHWDLLPNSVNARGAYTTVRAKIEGQFRNIFSRSIKLN
ncbi:MAG: hypothetical protein ACI865_003352 [Flavobacteriaceae bacterium]|jgi:hypothetical protein